MNQMNFDEYVFGSGDLFCFAARKIADFARKYAILAVRDITNVLATHKKWFINVHLVHLKAFFGWLSYKLMNLMNINELAYCLRLFFAMYPKLGWFQVPSFMYQVHASSFSSLKGVPMNEDRNWSRPEGTELDENIAALRRMRVIVWMLVVLVMSMIVCSLAWRF